MDLKLKGLNALVTGGTKGIGRAIAETLAAEGANVAFCARNADGVDSAIPVLSRHGGKVFGRAVDVGDGPALKAWVAEAGAALGGIDIVVANAGISSWGRVWEMSEDTWQSMIDINLTGVWHTFKAAIPTMIEQGRGGSIIAIASVAGIKSLPSQAHYSAAKHGVVGLTKTTAIELGPYGIRVNSIHPWGVATPMALEDPTVPEMLEANPHYMGSFGSILADPMLADPDDISNAVVYLASDMSRCVTGIQLPVDMGATTV